VFFSLTRVDVTTSVDPLGGHLAGALNMSAQMSEVHSPFPGMDPYTEARHLWKGLHTQLIGELSTHQLPPLLAPAYFVDAEPSLQIRHEGTAYPDLQIMARREPAHPRPAGLGLAVVEPTAVITAAPVEDEEEEESAIFIREAATERLVTVIEILSYSNKTAGVEKRARYLLKRRETLASGVHLVEIDLLRWGQRVVTTLPDQPYHILVSRADEQLQSRIWSFGLADPIPDTPLPLIAPGEYVPLPLQAAYQLIYQARRFRSRLDYQLDPSPPLTETQQTYIQRRLVEAGLRPPPDEAQA
jgi:hypothetical protein